MTTRRSLGERVQSWLSRPSIVWTCAALALLLALPAVGSHRVFDDFLLALGAQGSQDGALPAHRFGALDLFRFTNGSVEENGRLRDLGSMLPWWTDPHLQIAFFRPLSALTHLLDQWIWPEHVGMQYVHSLAWLGLLVAAVAYLYRALGGPPAIAGLAALLYAMDDAHGSAMAWLSNRNGIIAAAFGTIAVAAHDRWRKSGSAWPAVVAAASLLAGLLAGEFALATCGYLLAYACVWEQGPLRRRAASLLPYAGLVAAWAFVYKTLGYGAKASGMYIDPLGDGWRFARDVPARAAALLGATFGPVPADVVMFVPGAEHRGLVIAAVTLLFTASLLLPVLRRDRQARFWALGMSLAIAPALASYPTDRLLLLSGIGGMALIARIVADLDGPCAGLPLSAPRALVGLRRFAIGALAFVHLVVAPVALVVRSGQMRQLARALTPNTEVLDAIPDLAQRTVIIVNPPIDPFASYIQAEHAWRGAARPRHLYWLAGGVAPIRITRAGPRALTVRREGGLITTPAERLYRSSASPLRAGEVVELSEMRAEVLSTTADERPLEVRFEFASALESEPYVFLVWDGDRLIPFDLPTEYETRQLPTEDVAQIVFAPSRRPLPADSDDHRGGVP